jgi:Cof subfamily protein (haloacid dehalogenase superfamily)
MTIWSQADGRRRPAAVSLLLSDVDGTLVTKDKRLTPATVDAVRRLGESGIAFAITSSRPPQGLLHLIEPLNLTTPIAGFNSGMVMDRDRKVLRRYSLDAEITRRVIAMLDARGIDVWFFNGNDWLIRDVAGVYVDHEHKTIGYGPIETADFEHAFGGATKIVGVSGDFARLAQCEGDMRNAFGNAASIALSQSYYLDITHLDANKGSAVLALAKLFNISTSEIATIGDMSNDVRMFEKSGFSIAMGNATDAVKARANVTTESNQEDGFAKAVERFILPVAPAGASQRGL